MNQHERGLSEFFAGNSKGTRRGRTCLWPEAEHGRARCVQKCRHQIRRIHDERGFSELTGGGRAVKLHQLGRHVRDEGLHLLGEKPRQTCDPDDRVRHLWTRHGPQSVHGALSVGSRDGLGPPRGRKCATILWPGKATAMETIQDDLGADDGSAWSERGNAVTVFVQLSIKGSLSRISRRVASEPGAYPAARHEVVG